jgi:hypothetical protein
MNTPRTDAELKKPKVELRNGAYHYTEEWSGAVSGKFARQLECELTAAQEKLKVAEDALEDIARWDQETQDKAEAGGYSVNLWRGCVAVAKQALAALRGS